jgi:cyclopropane fatty-acyl-phospholipid synthase-like methyltransferase
MTQSSGDSRFLHPRFPKSNAYHPDWVHHVAMGSHCLWLIEWLTGSMELRPGMRVLDLGCGKAATSIFLAREFGVTVWATDLWINATENLQRIRDAGCEHLVYPLHCDSRSLPYAAEFFDAVIALDSYSYFGTDDLYLNYLAQFVKVGGQIAIAGAGLTQEIPEQFPEHLREQWTQDYWCLHSPGWWRRLWERTGIVDIEVSENMSDGCQVWLDWQKRAHPENVVEIAQLEADGGRYMGFIRQIARRRGDATLQDYCWPDTLKSMPTVYERYPLLREA